jgi:uncharacterized phage-associated protein
VATARGVANVFIRLAQAEGKPLTPMQIMKLVYIAHGWSLAVRHRPLITDRIEAWKYGPVIPDLYQAVKEYGSAPVTVPVKAGLFGGDAVPPDEEEQEFVERVYKLYRGFNGIQLSAMTHRPDTPWSQTWAPNLMNAEVSNDLIADHYRRLKDERGA